MGSLSSLHTNSEGFIKPTKPSNNKIHKLFISKIAHEHQSPWPLLDATIIAKSTYRVCIWKPSHGLQKTASATIFLDFTECSNHESIK
ncbi:hypothetical protein HQ38_07555 [Porphyromonas crevioricanis]|uniref:Uncharacterized protein n=1 Tax=Porphyromonas crevioricanis TaxID=393921 RepID=A0AB34PEU1_9PORP|nr:hypothetical protein HQ38_07555 [Porphyromonas crevioricanis]